MDQAIPPTRDLPLQLLVRLGRASAAQRASALFQDEGIAQFLGLGRQEARCLELVDRLGPVQAARLTAACGLSQGTVTALVDRLEAAGYVRRQRDGADRRNATVEVTALARDLLARLEAKSAEMAAAALDSLSVEQIEGLARFLEAHGWVGQLRARLLQEHLPVSPKPTSAERLAAAERFAQAAEIASRTIEVGLATGAVPSGIPEPVAPEQVAEPPAASVHSAA